MALLWSWVWLAGLSLGSCGPQNWGKLVGSFIGGALNQRTQDRSWQAKSANLLGNYIGKGLGQAIQKPGQPIRISWKEGFTSSWGESKVPSSFGESKVPSSWEEMMFPSTTSKPVRVFYGTTPTEASAVVGQAFLRALVQNIPQSYTTQRPYTVTTVRPYTSRPYMTEPTSRYFTTRQPNTIPSTGGVQTRQNERRYKDPQPSFPTSKSENLRIYTTIASSDNLTNSSCSCNGFITSTGEGECKTSWMLDGQQKAFCYVEIGTCKEQHKNLYGLYWSFLPCLEQKTTNARATTEMSKRNRPYNRKMPASRSSSSSLPALTRMSSSCPNLKPCRVRSGKCCEARGVARGKPSCRAVTYC